LGTMDIDEVFRTVRSQKIRLRLANQHKMQLWNVDTEERMR
jgi:hypothetical protein